MMRSHVSNVGPAEADTPTLQSLIRGAEHRQNVCVLALLTWVASCDGTIDDDELVLLRNVASGIAGGEAVLPAVIDVARLGRPDDLEYACRYLRIHAARADRPLLAELLITMAAQDGHLTVAENHVLRFLADVLGLSPRNFAKLFSQLIRRPFPEVGDISTLEWWQRREAGGQARAPADGWGAGAETAANQSRTGENRTTGEAESPSASGVMTRERALRMFGVGAAATRDEIRGAYLRLAKARHPDRFARLGAAAQATAAAAFVRLKEAYALLSTDMAAA